MSWRWREKVKSGNSTAVLKNYYANNLVILMDVHGKFEPGMTIVGQQSGTTTVLTSFIINDDYDIYYDYDGWDDLLEEVVVLDDGTFVAIDEMYFYNSATDADDNPDPTYLVSNRQ